MFAKRGQPLDVPALLRQYAVEVGECLEWRGPMVKQGRVPGIRRVIDGVRRDMLVGREVYKHYKGPIEPGMVVVRRCLNYRCVCAGHLIQAAPGMHMTLLAREGKAGKSPAARATMARVQRERSRYSEQQVQAVRELLRQGVKQAQIALDTGVHYSTVSEIKCGRAWRQQLPAASVWQWRGAA